MSWLAIDAGKELWRRTRTAWRGTPGGTLPRVVGGIVGWWIVMLGLCAATTLVAKSFAGDGLADWDQRQMEHVRDGTGWAASVPVPLTFTNGIIFESPSNIMILLPLTLVCVAVCLWKKRLVWAVAFALSYFLARFVIWIGWWLWDRQRPDLIADGAAALAAHSFPSGHALLTFTAYGLLTFLWAYFSRSWIERVLAFVPLLALATIVSLARLRLGAHWPSDCIAGVFLGGLWLAGVAASGVWAERHAGQRSGTMPPERNPHDASAKQF